MELNYKTFGQGDPIVILHGLFGMLDNWQTIAKKLAADYQVFLVDLPNHGRSPHTDTFTYPDMAVAVADFIKSLNIEAPHIIGHSMGAKVALNLAVDYPDLARSLVIVDMGMREYSPHHDSILAALGDLDIEGLQKRSDAEDALAVRIPDAGVRLFLMKNLTRRKEGGYEWKMNLPLILDNYANILKAVEPENPIKTPAIFIRGGKSKYVQDSDWPSIEEHLESAQLHTVENSGHWVHADKPQELLQALTDWLTTS